MSDYEYSAAWWYHAGQRDARRYTAGAQIALTGEDGITRWLALGAWALRIGRDGLALEGYLPEAVEVGVSPPFFGLAAPEIGTGPDGLPAAVRAALPAPADPRTLDEQIADLRAALHARRRALRQAAIDAGAPLVDGRLLQSDAESRSLIQGAMTLALAALMTGDTAQIAAYATTLGAGWRATDGTVCATDAAAIMGLGQLLAAHIAACDTASEAHRAAIDGAADLAALGEIDIDSGWPA
jgi:hypothetical protein